MRLYQSYMLNGVSCSYTFGIWGDPNGIGGQPRWWTQPPARNKVFAPRQGRACRFSKSETARVAVIGLGYVGLPLTLGFSKNSRSVGFDINAQEIAELRAGLDFTGEVKLDELKNINADFTSDPKFLANADVIIVCVQLQ